MALFQQETNPLVARGHGTGRGPGNQEFGRL
jgi:hypothetical protein